MMINEDNKVESEIQVRDQDCYVTGNVGGLTLVFIIMDLLQENNYNLLIVIPYKKSFKRYGFLCYILDLFLVIMENLLELIIPVM